MQDRRNWIKVAILAATIFASTMPFANAEVIYEDDPRWNCHTMGNGICGAGFILNGQEHVALIGLEVQ